jgi:hypothetical protein
MSSQVNIYIDKGTDFRLTVELFDEDDLDLPINSYEFFGDIRKLYSTKKAAEFQFQKSSNDITLILASDITSQLAPGKYQYDVIMKKQTGELSKIINGLAFVVSTITEV